MNEPKTNKQAEIIKLDMKVAFKKWTLRAGGVPPVVECLPNKSKTLSSNTSNVKKIIYVCTHIHI
jgi:hypothetical protein